MFLIFYCLEVNWGFNKHLLIKKVSSGSLFEGGLDVTLVGQSSQLVTFQIVSLLLRLSFISTFVHASCDYVVRQELWRDISRLDDGNPCWCVVILM